MQMINVYECTGNTRTATLLYSHCTPLIVHITSELCGEKKEHFHECFSFCHKFCIFLKFFTRIKSAPFALGHELYGLGRQMHAGKDCTDCARSQQSHLKIYSMCLSNGVLTALGTNVKLK